MKKILVTGGAGYIGSHMTRMLIERGHEVVVFDDLSTGHRDAVPAETLVQGDVGDRAALRRLFAAQPIDGVMHFAAKSQVGESMAEPGNYYHVNFSGTLALLEVMIEFGVRRMIHSSTAAIFGEPQTERIDERHPIRPLSPYGRSKCMTEMALADYERAHGLRFTCLRYFNAAGADPSGRLGERHEPETHLIPLVLQVAAGSRSEIRIFGADYDTPDGTCIRDYVHVNDLCEAHLLAYRRLQNGGASARYNLGNGNGFSVRQVVSAAARATGREIPMVLDERRAGDPARLVADASLARRELGWRPRYADLSTIVTHAWNWECRAEQAATQPPHIETSLLAAQGVALARQAQAMRP